MSDVGEGDGVGAATVGKENHEEQNEQEHEPAPSASNDNNAAAADEHKQLLATHDSSTRTSLAYIMPPKPLPPSPNARTSPVGKN